MPSCRIQVEVDRPGKSVVLVLVSYSQVAWDVTVASGTSLDRIVVSGYESSSVNGPERVEVQTSSFRAGDATALSYAYEWPSYNARLLEEQIETSLGLPVRSFHGCYQADSFRIH
jgi:hypothetical protein